MIELVEPNNGLLVIVAGSSILFTPFRYLYMRKLLCAPVILSLVLTYVNSYSQRKIAEFPVKLQKPSDAYICSDTLGNIGVLFQGNKQYEIDFLNSEYSVYQTAISLKLSSDKNQEIIGAVLNNGSYSAYFYDDRLKAISVITAKDSDGIAQYSKLKIFQGNEDYVTGFEMNAAFYVVTVIQNSNILKLYQLKGKDLEALSFELPMQGFYNAITREDEVILNLSFETSINLQEVSYGLDNNIRSAYSPNKLYHFDNKMVLTLDEPAMTHLITIDIPSRKTDYKKLNFELEQGTNRRGSTFLYKDLLFRSTLSNEQLNISVLDLRNMSLVRTYNFYSKEEIKIINSPIIEKENYGNTYGSTERVIKKSSHFYKSVLDGNYAIVANKIDSNRFELQLGSYELRNINQNGYRSPQASMGLSMSMGGYGYSLYGYPNYFPHQSAMKEKIVYFKTLIDQEKYSHIIGSVPSNMRERICDYKDQIFENSLPDILNYSATNRDAILLGYYTKSTRIFNIMEFKR